MKCSHPMIREFKLLMKDEGIPAKKDPFFLFGSIVLAACLLWYAPPPPERLAIGGILLLLFFMLFVTLTIWHLRWELPMRRLDRKLRIHEKRRRRREF